MPAKCTCFIKSSFNIFSTFNLILYVRVNMNRLHVGKWRSSIKTHFEKVPKHFAVYFENSCYLPLLKQYMSRPLTIETNSSDIWRMFQYTDKVWPIEFYQYFYTRSHPPTVYPYIIIFPVRYFIRLRLSRGRGGGGGCQVLWQSWK